MPDAKGGATCSIESNHPWKRAHDVRVIDCGKYTICKLTLQDMQSGQANMQLCLSEAAMKSSPWHQSHDLAPQRETWCCLLVGADIWPVKKCVRFKILYLYFLLNVAANRIPNFYVMYLPSEAVRMKRSCTAHVDRAALLLRVYVADLGNWPLLLGSAWEWPADKGSDGFQVKTKVCKLQYFSVNRFEFYFSVHTFLNCDILHQIHGKNGKEADTCETLVLLAKDANCTRNLIHYQQAI